MSHFLVRNNIFVTECSRQPRSISVSNESASFAGELLYL